MATTAKARLSEDALFRRCKRALRRQDGTNLHRCPERSRSFGELGRYYISDDNNCLAAWGSIDLEELAAELKINAELAE